MKETLTDMDKGPWSLFYDTERLIGVISDDFKHDGLIALTGDFSCDREVERYHKLSADKLNTLPTEEPTQ